MIDRIDGIGGGSTYQQLNKRVQNNKEPFLLNDTRLERRVGEAEKKEDSAIEAVLRKNQEADGGVKVELSGAAAKAAAEKPPVQDRQEEGGSGDLWDRLLNLWKDIKTAFVKFFNGGVERIDEKDITVVDADESSREEADTDVPKTQEEFRGELLAHLYENGEKTIAKNSDLLTAYNKRGSLVQMNAGDKNRILHMHPSQVDERF